MNVNVYLMTENVTRIKCEIITNVDVSTKIKKNIMHVKNIILAILLTTCSCENAEYLTSAIDDSVISCNETINGSVNFMR